MNQCCAASTKDTNEKQALKMKISPQKSHLGKWSKLLLILEKGSPNPK